MMPDVTYDGERPLLDEAPHCFAAQREPPGENTPICLLPKGHEGPHAWERRESDKLNVHQSWGEQ